MIKGSCNYEKERWKKKIDHKNLIIEVSMVRFFLKRIRSSRISINEIIWVNQNQIFLQWRKLDESRVCVYGRRVIILFHLENCRWYTLIYFYHDRVWNEVICTIAAKLTRISKKTINTSKTCQEYFRWDSVSPTFRGIINRFVKNGVKFILLLVCC